MSWSLLEEYGIEYAAPSANAGPDLCHPVAAARAADGATTVVDELGIRKSVPMRAEYRTFRIAPGGKLLADSWRWGIADGYGVPSAESLAILCVTRWELQTRGPTGERVATLDLASLSKRLPLVVSRTWRDTFLLAFADELFEVDLAEVDDAGRLLWYLPAPPDSLGFPGSVQLLRNGNLLVADEFCHVVTELALDGSIVWQLGNWRDPGRHGGRLSSPRTARETHDGTRLVADTRNDRLLAVAADGRITVLPEPEGGLSAPTFAELLPGGNVLLCDAGNRRVVECGSGGEVVWSIGGRAGHRRSFSFPRSVQGLDGGALLVCDTANDRIVVAGGGARSCEPWPLEGGAELFWPRCARILPSGSLLVADGRNSRVLELTPAGEVTRSLHALGHEAIGHLADPHDVHLLPGGNLLITDSPPGLVLEVDWSGRIHRTIGQDRDVELADPHSAQPLAGGTVMICDSGNDRVLWVRPDGTLARELRAVRSGSSWLRLSRPRHAEVSASGILVIADTGNNRVLAVDGSGALLWELSTVPDSPLPWLDQPRWAQLDDGEVIVCDHCHHRILRLRHEPPGGSSPSPP